MKISVVSPVYLGEHMIVELVSRLNSSLRLICDDYEIILVEDGSPDESWSIIESLCQEQHHIKGIKLSRNFGQHYAITCGLEAAKGDWIVVMDCDLQDKPEEIPNLFKKSQDGFDIVLAQRTNRKDSLLKRMSSLSFYSLFSYLTDTDQDPTVANFGIYQRKVIDAILSMKDRIRYFPTMIQWVGFDRTKISVDHAFRKEGDSSYSWKALLTLATRNILAFSEKPLKLTVRLGFLLSFTSFIIGLVYLYQYLSGQIVVLGFASVIISLFFLSGLIILTLGVIGLYIGKIFAQVKDRPVFIIKKRLNYDE